MNPVTLEPELQVLSNSGEDKGLLPLGSPLKAFCSQGSHRFKGEAGRKS